MANLIIADGQYETISVNTTVTAVTGKQYYYKNTSAGNIDVTYGLTTVTMAPDTILILLYDGTDWSDLTPRLVGGDTTVGNLTITGLTTVSSSGITSSSSSINLLKPATTTGTALEQLKLIRDTDSNQYSVMGGGGNVTQYKTVNMSASKYTSGLHWWYTEAQDGVSPRLMELNGFGRLLLSSTDNEEDLLQVGGSILSTVPSNETAFKAKADGTVIISLENNVSKNWSFVARSSGATPANGFQILESDVGASMTFFSGGNIGIGSAVDNGSDLLQVGSDDDISVSLGRGKLGYFGAGSENEFAIAHCDMFNTTDYAFYQNPNGVTIVNAKLNQEVRIRNNNVDVATFSGSQIDLFKSTYITDSNSSTSFDGLILSNDQVADITDPSQEFNIVARPRINNGGTDYSDMAKISFVKEGGWGSLSARKMGIAFYTASTANPVDSSTEKMRITSTGNILIGTDVVDNGSDLLQVGSDTNISASIGRTKLHSSFSDFAMFSHIDYADQTNYALAHRNNGSTILNCVTGGSVAIWNGGSTGQVAYFSQTEIEFRKNLNGKRIMSSGFDVAPSTGAYIQAYYDPGVGNEWGTILSYDYDAAEYKRVRLEGSNVLLNATTGNNVIVGSTLDNGSDLLQVGSDDDISVSLGRTKIGGATSDQALVSHYDHYSVTNAGFRQNPDGYTVLNAPTGQAVGIRNNNNINVATFSGSQIDLLKDIYISPATGNSSLYLKRNDSISDKSLIRSIGSDSSRYTSIELSYDNGIQLQPRLGNTAAKLTNTQIDLLKDTVITGNLSKTSGSFRIPHPLKETHDLVHSFVEAPTADNIYSGMVFLIDGKAEINLDQASGMTEGTFLELNTTLRRHTSNESGFTKVISRIEGNILIIEAEDNNCTDEIYWQVIGERQDKQIKESCLTDEKGKVIVEPLKKENK